MKKAICFLLTVFTVMLFAVSVQAEETSLAGAIASGAQFYQLTDHVDGVTISGDILLDLNGYDVTNAVVAEGVSLQLMDSANDTYDLDACGSFRGQIDGTVAPLVKTQDHKNYLVICSEGVYTAHRFYAGIDRVSLDPANAALGYKATFCGDDVVKSQVESYGFRLWVNDHAGRAFLKEEAFTQTELTLRVKNILQEADPDMSAQGAAAQIYAHTVVNFTGLETYSGAVHATTLQQAVESVNAILAEDRTQYTTAQVLTMQAFCRQFSGYMTGWQTENIFAQVFENKLGKEAFLYRVGNRNAVALGSLFTAITDQLTDVTVEIEAVSGQVSGVYTPNALWSQGSIQFSGSGVVKVSIEAMGAQQKELLLEVVDAKNITKAENATGNNVVLLNDISGSLTVSGNYTLYGNGFTITLPTDSVKSTSVGFAGYITLGSAQSGGHLDNVRIEGPVYPEMYIYRDDALITDPADPNCGSGSNTRYFVNSVTVMGGDVTIRNCYISGSRTALCVNGGNQVLVENTTLSGGAYANMQINAGSSVTLRDLTTLQQDAVDSYGQGKTVQGIGIVVDSNVVELYIEGQLKQYNWMNQSKWERVIPSDVRLVFPKFFTNSNFNKHWHYLDGETAPYVNLGMIFACNWDTAKIHDDREAVDYGTTGATILNISGGVYTNVNTVSGNALTQEALVYPGYGATGYYPVAPVFAFENKNHDPDDTADAYDPYCVYTASKAALKIGLSGGEKTLDLSGVTIKDHGQPISYTAYLNGNRIDGSTVTLRVSDGAKQTLTFAATVDHMGYDPEGNPIAGQMEYAWSITVELAVLSYPAPVWNMGGSYQFAATTNGVYAYYGTSNGYGEAVQIYEGIKVNYYDKSGQLVQLDLSGTKTLPTSSDNANATAFTYTLADGSVLTMKYSSGFKSNTTHQYTVYKDKVYIYPESLDNDNYIRAKVTNQNFDVKLTYTFTDPNGQSTPTQTMRWYNAAASNGSVPTVQWKEFDTVNGKKPSTCVTGDTLVTLSDGTQKPIRDVTYADQLLVWDFYTGQYTAVPAAIIFDHGYGNNTVIQLDFSDGTSVKVINLHQFMDATQNRFVSIDAQSVAQYLGHEFVKRHGDGYKTVRLVDYTVTNEYVAAYGMISAKHYNVLVNGMWSTDFMEQDYPLFHYFAIGEGMMFDQTAMAQDIETYGLYTYADFAQVLSYEQFVAFHVQYFKIAVGKGLYTYEGIVNLIDSYL